MMKIIRDKRTGNYYTEDGRYEIEKGVIGWNVNELNKYRSVLCGEPIYSYSFTCETLKEVRESL